MESNSLTQSKKRIRATVACTYCRSKRSKCDGVPGTKPCSQCNERGMECEMSSGKRNRGHYKPQVEALQQRVRKLEKALEIAAGPSWNSNEPSPDVWDSPQGILTPPSSRPQVQQAIPPTVNPASSWATPYQTSISGYLNHAGSAFADAQSQQPLAPYSQQTDDFVSGNVESEKSLFGLKSLDDLRLTQSVVDYLLGLYFHRYQLMLNCVSQRDFMTQKAAGHGPMLRESLILAMLAIAMRYNTREEINRAYLRPDGENVFATAAKKALETELRHTDITTVKAMLILAEVETSAGHDMTGYLYYNLAAKQVLDLGLDLGSLSNQAILNLNNEDVECRHWIVWAASVGDQYWAVSLRKTLTIKSNVLQFTRLAAKFARISTTRQRADTPLTFEQQINENLLELLVLSREITETMYSSGVSQNSPGMGPTISKLDSRLDQLFDLLPIRMKRGPAKEHDFYHFLFTLHFFYNVCKIILYRDIAKAQDLSIRLQPKGPVKIITQAALRIAKLFALFRRREDVRTMQSTGAQIAGLAARALIDHVKELPAENAVQAVGHLQILADTLADMSKTFAHATEVHKEVIQTLQTFDAHPGAINGDLLRDIPPVLTPIWDLPEIESQSSNQGAATSGTFSSHHPFIPPLRPTYVMNSQPSSSPSEDAHHVLQAGIPESLAETWNWDDIMQQRGLG